MTSSAAPTTTRTLDAFVELETLGVLARADFACCGTCLLDEIGAERTDDRPWYGYVAFHRQDTERLLENGATYLAFGLFIDAFMSEAEWGSLGEEQQDAWYSETLVALMREQVIPVLEKHGHEIEWNGSTGTRLLMKNSDFWIDLEAEDEEYGSDDDFDGDDAFEGEMLGDGDEVASMETDFGDIIVLYPDTERQVAFVHVTDPDEIDGEDAPESYVLVRTTATDDLVGGAIIGWHLTGDGVRLTVADEAVDMLGLESETTVFEFEEPGDAAVAYEAVKKMLVETGEEDVLD